MCAAWAGNADTLKTLMSSGADVNVNNWEGKTPLMAAAIYGHHDAVNILLSSKADSHTTDSHGYTAENYARSVGNDSIARLLTGAEASSSIDSLDESPSIAQDGKDQLSGLPPELIAELGIGAAKMARAAETLGNVSNAAQGRSAMRRAADILADLTPDSPLIPKLRDSSDLDDSQIVGLCQQMTLSLVDQAQAMAKLVERQASQVKPTTSSRSGGNSGNEATGGPAL
jgi:ankyrin repeat protein